MNDEKKLSLMRWGTIILLGIAFILNSLADFLDSARIDELEQRIEQLEAEKS